MSRLPSMQTLRALEAAARHGSYSAAAEELGLTHSAISHRIRELEERLKFPLFRRVGRSMAPTREAVTMIAQVRQAMVILQHAFPDTPQRRRESLVVSVHPALATRWLIPRLPAFTEMVPEITVELRSTADLGDFLAPGVDIAIRYGAGGWPNTLSDRLAEEVLFPVCSPRYRDEHDIQKPADLARCTLLRHAWQRWSPWLREAKLKMREPVSGVILSDSSMLIEAAAADQGVALTRRLFVEDVLARGRVVRLFDISVMDTLAYYVVWQAGDRLSPAAELFRTWLRQEMAAQAPIAA